MSQLRTKQVKLVSIMRTAAFVRGYKEARAGKPINYEAFFGDTNGQWQYERGRQFGHIFDGALKHGARVTYDAHQAFRDALINRVIL